MKKLAFTAFVLVFLIAYVTLMVEFGSILFFDYELLPTKVIGLSFLVVVVLYPVWAVWAGIMGNARGWSVFGTTKTIPNALASIIFHFTIAPFTAFHHWREMRITGRIFPTPQECTRAGC